MSISAAELNNYKQQLKQVEAAIQLDPENEELKSLADGLKEVIGVAEDLAKLIAKPAPKNNSGVEETPFLFKEGEICEAHYSADGNWYPAKVNSVSGDGLLYTIQYMEYDDTEILRAASLRRLEKERVEEIQKESRKRAAKEAMEGTAESQDDKKKKRFKDKKAHQEKKTEEMVKKQASWSNFKNKVKPKQSIFASPETIEGKVGVTGSGKGTTDYLQRKKHEFEKNVSKDD